MFGQWITTTKIHEIVMQTLCASKKFKLLPNHSQNLSSKKKRDGNESQKKFTTLPFRLHDLFKKPGKRQKKV